MAQRVPQRLYRSRTEKMIAGVCGGLGEYFDVDPVLVRLGFVILTILGSGVGVLIYLVLWIVIPKEGTLTATRSALWRENVEDMVSEARRLGDDIREAIDPVEPRPTAPAGEAAAARPEPIDAERGSESGAERSGEVWAPGPVERSHTPHRRQMLVGAFLVVVGLWLLADNFHLLGWVRGELFWPLTLVVVGGWLLLRQVRRPD